MRHLRTLALILAAAAASHALGDRTVFDTTHAPAPANPRKAAPFVVALELGANSLSSVLGGRFTWYPVQNLAVDLGGSWSTAGLRGGVGARYFLRDSGSAPFVGAAWKRSAGIDSASLDDGKQSVSEVTLNPEQWVDAQAGWEYRSHDGLVVVLTTGWSFPITSKRSTVVRGQMSQDAKDNLDLYTGGGPIAAVAVGFGF
jgi:hypothetical protein